MADEARAVPLNDSAALGRLRERLVQEGHLTFAAFMAEALYGPEGYYTRRPRLGGASADFFTSPELHPAFGALLGRLAARVWSALGQPDRFDLVEHGPGTGVLSRDLLAWADHAAPAFAACVRYRLIETSPALQALQQETVTAAGLLDGRISWAELPPLSRLRERGSGGEGYVGEGEFLARPTVGLTLANELVDALPVHLVAMRDGTLYERYVVLDADRRDGLGWREDEPSTPALTAYFERLGVWPGDGSIAEVNLHGVTWMEEAAASLDRGALLVLDYGYPAPELYAPSRRFGTLLTYRGHALGSDPLRHVGEKDITAHVDFTSLARAGERAGLDTVGLIGQAALLRRLGLDGYLHKLDHAALSATDHDANRRALLALVEPTGLGNVQGLLQTRGLPGFDPFAPDAGAPDGTADTRAPNGSWLPLLRPGQMRLPGPLEAEGFIDLDAQWQEFLSECADDAAADSDPAPPP